MARAIAAWALGAALAILSTNATASPQGHVALRTSLCGTGTDAIWQTTHWCNGISGDLLLGRKRNSDFGLGPFAEVSTAGFWDARYGGGLSALAPVTENFPLVLSLGAFGHETESVALGGSLFFGARSYNFGSAYNLAAGFVVSGYRDLGAENATLVSIGLEIDGFFLAAPFLFLAGELR